MSRGGQRGFTLFEVLVALTIMAGVTTTVLGLIVSARDRDARATAQLRGLLAVESILARLGLDLPLAPHAATGTFPEGARWALHIRPWDGEPNSPAQPDPALLAVAVHIDPQRGPAIVLQTLRATLPQ